MGKKKTPHIFGCLVVVMIIPLLILLPLVAAGYFALEIIKDEWSALLARVQAWREGRWPPTLEE